MQLPFGLRQSAVLARVMHHALDAAGRLQQIAVRCLIPAPVEARLGEHRIECHAVIVTLSVRKSPVDVEDQSAQGIAHVGTLASRQKVGQPMQQRFMSGAWMSWCASCRALGEAPPRAYSSAATSCAWALWG